MTEPDLIVADLGLGNLRSVVRALERAGAQPRVTHAPEEVASARRIVVPGQGGFGDCAAALQGGLGDALREAIDSGAQYLGICLGMQMLLESSEEAPGARGLGIFKGTCKKFTSGMRDPATQKLLKVPHMGWNEVSGHHPLLAPQGWYYFVHSYFCAPEDASLTVGSAEYGQLFCAALAKGPIFGCQFHPEKSHEEGQRMLERFVKGGAWS